MPDEPDDKKEKDENIYLVCTACARTFYLNPKEQIFYESMHFTLPRRCHGCRQFAKAKKDKEDRNK